MKSTILIVIRYMVMPILIFSAIEVLFKFSIPVNFDTLMSYVIITVYFNLSSWKLR